MTKVTPFAAKINSLNISGDTQQKTSLKADKPTISPTLAPAQHGLALKKSPTNSASESQKLLKEEQTQTRSQGLLSSVRSFAPNVAAAIMGAGLFLGAPGAALAQEAPPVEPEKKIEVVQDSSKVSKTDNQAHTKAILSKIDEVAQKLEAEGDTQSAQHVRQVMEIHAPGGSLNGSLGALVSALNGDPDAKAMLADAMAQGKLKPEQQEDGSWKISVGAWTGNDNAATIFDGRYRSDDGATASIGTQVLADRGNEQLAWDLSLNLLTETNYGMQRTDFVEGLFSYTKHQETGGVYLDGFDYTLTTGFQGVGNFNGAQIQNSWHELNENNVMGGRTLGNGLQDQYTSSRQYAAVLGGGAKAHKSFGMLDLSAGAETKIPIGSQGLGWVAADVGFAINRDGGLYGEGGIQVREQWTNGQAMDFGGAPIEGTVYVPRLGVGWQGDKWAIGLEWNRNHMGIQPGMGDKDADHIFLQLTIGGGQRR